MRKKVDNRQQQRIWNRSSYVIFGLFQFRVQRMTQQRQYRCREPPTDGGGVTGAK